MITIWNCSFTIAYNDGSIEHVGVVKDEDGSRFTAGSDNDFADAIKLPKFVEFLATLGISSTAVLPDNVVDYNFRFYALSANGRVDVLGTTEDLSPVNITSDDLIVSDLTSDSDFNAYFNTTPRILSIHNNLLSRYSEIDDLIPNRFKFKDNPFYMEDTFGKPYLKYSDRNYFGYDLIKDVNGKYLWTGWAFTGIQGAPGPDGTPYNLIRFNSDWTLDQTFNLPTFEHENEQIISRYVKSLSSGKYILVGNFPKINNTTVNYIARINNDGTLDNSYLSGTGFNGPVISACLLPDESLVVGGNFTSYDGDACVRLCKLNPDGTLNSTFTANAATIALDDTSGSCGVVGAMDCFFDGAVHWIEYDQVNDKFYIGGQFSNSLIRLNSNGTADATFNVGSGFNGRVASVSIEPGTGKVFVLGWFTSYNGDDSRKYVVKLNTNGSLDNSFYFNYDLNSIYNQSMVLHNNQLYITGWFTTLTNLEETVDQRLLMRLNSDGSLDKSFNVRFNGSSSYAGPRVQRLLLEGDYIYAVGTLISINEEIVDIIARFDYDGNLDTSFRSLSAIGLAIGFDGINDKSTGLTNLPKYSNMIKSLLNTNYTADYDSISGLGSPVDTDYTSYISSSIKLTHPVVDLSGLRIPFDSSTQYYDINVNPSNIMQDLYFGAGSSYFTNRYGYFFALVADGSNINQYFMNGLLYEGPSFSNNIIEDLYSIQLDGYACYAKTSHKPDISVSYAYNAVNHILIAPGSVANYNFEASDPAVADEKGLNQFRLQGLQNLSELYHLIIITEPNSPLSQSDITSIANKFLEIIG